MPDRAGVVIAPARVISDSIKAAVDRTLGELPPGTHGAIVGIATDKGVNLAIAHRSDHGWEVAAYIGKTWTGPIEGGAFVKKTW